MIKKYGRSYETMFTGSMIGAGANIFSVWGYCITYAKPPHGSVELNPKLLAYLIGCEQSDVVKAIEFLCAPDKNSRTKTDDGRRLRFSEGFEYVLVNWDLYHTDREAENYREYHRNLMRKLRAREKAASAPGTGLPPVETPPLKPPKQDLPENGADNEIDSARPAEPSDSGIMDLVIDIQTCRMEYTNLNTMAIENVLKDVPIEAARRGVKDFCRDECTAVNANRTPLKMLAGYLRTAMDGKGKGGKKSKTPSMTLEDIKTMNTAGMPKETG
ncbi:MAG: hypothetical protein Q7J98_04060 [Kiritimatiellia bacterium]|nr:hypothetical protein [Kiritimatiellia bacterium]